MVVIKRTVAANNLYLLRGMSSVKFSRDYGALNKELLPDEYISKSIYNTGYLTHFIQRYTVDFYCPKKWMSPEGFIVNQRSLSAMTSVPVMAPSLLTDTTFNKTFYRNLEQMVGTVLNNAVQGRVSAGNPYGQMCRLIDCWYQSAVTMKNMPPDKTTYLPIGNYYSGLVVPDVRKFLDAALAYNLV